VISQLLSKLALIDSR